MSLDGEKWTPVGDRTLKSALDYAHSCLHRASEKCSEKLDWKLDKSTQAKVLGECTTAQIRAWSLTLKRSVDARTVVGE
jgi:hypothetical protein